MNQTKKATKKAAPAPEQGDESEMLTKLGTSLVKCRPFGWEGDAVDEFTITTLSHMYDIFREQAPARQSERATFSRFAEVVASQLREFEFATFGKAQRKTKRSA